MLRQIYCCLILFAASSALAEKLPNIVVIWGEDLGYEYLTEDNEDIRACWTPNIDRVAMEGAIFTNAYGEHGSTAARGAFITGQSPFRAGLSRTAGPGAGFGLRNDDPTIAEYLKAKGYRTAKYGKYHLGDRDAHLPTNHGFDEFFGSLYDLDEDIESGHAERPNAEQLSERRPRGVIRSFADGRIEDTGPLSPERVEGLDREVTDRTLDFIGRAAAKSTPFFVWWSSTRSQINIEDGIDDDQITKRIFQHDGYVGQILDQLDELGLTDSTIVVYSSDSGSRIFAAPGTDTSSHSSDQNDSREDRFRVPLAVRWPGVIEPGMQVSEIVSHLDWFPTFAAALGDSEINESLKQGMRLSNKRVKVHLDGYNVLPYLRGTVGKWPREEYFYFSDTGELLSIRHGEWKIIFSERREPWVAVWSDPFVLMHAPRLINLREDPAEAEFDYSTGNLGWYVDRLHVLTPAQNIVGEFLISFEQFPPRDQASQGFSFARLLGWGRNSVNK